MEQHTHAGDSATLRVTFDRGSGSEALEQRVIRFAPGRSGELGPEEREEALFVLEGRGALLLDGARHKLEPDPARPRLLATEPGVGYRLRDELL